MRNKQDIVNYIPLAMKVAMGYRNKGLTLEELKGLAIDGLLVARDKHDPKRGSMATAVRLYVRGKISDAFRKLSRSIQMNAAYQINEETDSYSESTDYCPFNIVARMDEIELVKTSLSILPERHKLIIESRYLREDTLSLQEIADSMNVSAERIRQIEVRALELLKEELTNTWK